MRKNNWIVAAIAAVACGVLLWAWFALGSDRVDDPLGLAVAVAGGPLGRRKGGFLREMVVCERSGTARAAENSELRYLKRPSGRPRRS